MFLAVFVWSGPDGCGGKALDIKVFQVKSKGEMGVQSGQLNVHVSPS